MTEFAPSVAQRAAVGVSATAPDATAPCGRFAPTPSGPLHLGSLSTAVGSWLRIRHAGGRWRLRIDDLDRARCPPGMEAEIQDQLQTYGLYWDGDAVRQSQHLDAYEAAIKALEQVACLYPCICSRAALRERHAEGSRYDRHCLRRSPPEAATPRAIRLQMPDTIDPLYDAVRGRVAGTGEALGDPVLRRRDGVIGYTLACAVDEALMQVTEVYRGEDLLQESFSQREVLRRLHQPVPRYGHLPVLRDPSGRKLSKQNHAAPLPLSPQGRVTSLLTVLNGLGYDTQAAAQACDAAQLLHWAVAQPLPQLLR